jgi:phosphoribosyl 1,2-cyclic phosphodiesterase
MIYEILASGSDGNATIINHSILIDCGVPAIVLKPYVRGLKLVLLTHEHCDHFRFSTVRWLAHTRPAIRWGCCEWMVQKLLDAGVMPRQIDVLTPDETVLYPSLMTITPVELTHNVRNCGYKLMDDFSKLFYATDTGTLEGIEAKGYDTYLVEANHSRAELEKRAKQKTDRGEYAYEVKAAENHLSIEQAVDWLTENMGPNSVWIPMHQHKERMQDDGREKDVYPEDH